MVVSRRNPPTPATLADLEALPPGVKGEIIEGVLYTQPRPRPRHQNVAGDLIDFLRGPMQRGSGGGPGGWWIVVEPGIRLPQAAEFSPDVAGWRKERMPDLPEIAIGLVPDWICEILSPGTRGHDLLTKRAFYARIGVQWLWYVDLDNRTLTASRLHDGHWLELGVYGEDQKVRIEPFEAVELDLAPWWPVAEAPPTEP